MKKHLKMVRVLTFVMALVLLSSLTNVAALRQTTVIEDNFDAQEFVGALNTDEWNQIGNDGAIVIEELVKPGKVLKFNGNGITAETAVLMTDWYWEIHSLSFDIMVPKDADWFALDFVDIEVPTDYCGDYGAHGTPMCYDSFMLSPKSVLGLGTTWQDWGFKDTIIGDEWVSIKFEVKDETAKIFIAPKGTPFDESKYLTTTLTGDRSFFNSAVVFGDYRFDGYKLDNIMIETDQGTFKEDFEDGKNDLLQTVTIHEEQNKFSFEVVDEGGSRKLAFKGADAEDRIISNTKIKAQSEYLGDSEIPLSVEYSVSFPKGSNGEIAYLFGLEDTDSDPFSDTWAFITGPNSGRLSYFDMQGKEKVKGNCSYSSSDVSVSIKLNKDGLLTVWINNQESVKYKGVEKYDGYTGFAVRKKISQTVYLDSVKINNLIYHVIQTKSFKDDFSENRLGTSDNSDYACNTEYGTLNVSGGELIFDACSDNSYFGPAYEYETYELSFKLTSILTTENKDDVYSATYAGRWIGLDFGKSSSIIKQYGSYGMLGLFVTHPEDTSFNQWDKTNVFIYKNEEMSRLKRNVVKTVADIPASLFKDISYDGKSKLRSDISPESAVCIKYVAELDRISLYLKRADEKDYKLYVTVENVEPAGYFALCCTGFSSWTIDDFEVNNTAEIFEEAPEVVLEETVYKTLAERGVGVENNGYAEEIKLNKNKSKGVPVGGYIAVCGVVLLLAAGLTTYGMIRKKKKLNTAPQERGTEE